MESKVLQETKQNGLNYNYLSLGNLKSINTLLNSIDKLPEEAIGMVKQTEINFRFILW